MKDESRTPCPQILFDKIMDWDRLVARSREWKKQGRKIVFTNGCFDIIHKGHVHYLAQAKDLGDILVVGLNSDASVKRLKGEHRPIQSESSRLAVLASLFFVDAVVLFYEDTPADLIQLLLPDILVKGGDWKPENIVGADVVIAAGGQVCNLPFVDGYSTTLIESKIKKG